LKPIWETPTHLIESLENGAAESGQANAGVFIMLALRNVLLAINGLCFLSVLYVLERGSAELRWLPILILIYLVPDFIYLSLSFPPWRILPRIVPLVELWFDAKESEFRQRLGR
jgi:hypothetical protein